MPSSSLMQLVAQAPITWKDQERERQLFSLQTQEYERKRLQSIIEQQQAEQRRIQQEMQGVNGMASIAALGALQQPEPIRAQKFMEALDLFAQTPGLSDAAKMGLEKYKSFASNPDALKMIPGLMDPKKASQAAQMLQALEKGDLGSLSAVGDTGVKPALKEVYDPKTGLVTYQFISPTGAQNTGLQAPSASGVRPSLEKVYDEGTGKIALKYVSPTGVQDTGLFAPPRVGDEPKFGAPKEVPSQKFPGKVDIVAYDDRGNKRVLDEGIAPKAYAEKMQESLASSNQAFANKLQKESLELESQKFGLAKIKQTLRSAPVEQGMFSDYKLLARELSSYIPGVSSLVDQESIGPSQLINSITAGLRMDSITGSLAGVSNYEQQIIQQMLPSLSQTPEGFGLVLDYRDAFIKRKQELNDYIQNKFADAQMNAEPVSLAKSSQDWLKSHPIQNYIPQSLEDRTDEVLQGNVSPRALPAPQKTYEEGSETGGSFGRQQPTSGSSGRQTYFSRQWGYELDEQQLQNTYREAKADGFVGTFEDFKKQFGFEVAK